MLAYELISGSAIDLRPVLTTATGYPFIQTFYNSTQSLAATNAMVAPIIIMATFSSASVMASASRQLFAFARDQAVPFSPWVAQVCSDRSRRQVLFSLTTSQIEPNLLIPLHALVVTFVGAVVIVLVNIGSSVALNTILSLGLSAFSTAFFVCISCGYSPL